MAAVERPTINVTILSDVICPWCWVGKRTLMAAIETAKDKYKFNVRIEPFLLKPDTPDEGTEKPTPSPDKPRVSPRLKEAGKEVGIDFTGKGERYPNTIPAHALLEMAEETGKQMELSELLYTAHFTEGVFLDRATLAEFAEKVGIEKMKAMIVMSDKAVLDRIAAKAMHWRMKPEITGVPTYFMNGVTTFSGSRSIEEFINMFHVIATNHRIVDEQ